MVETWKNKIEARLGILILLLAWDGRLHAPDYLPFDIQIQLSLAHFQDLLSSFVDQIETHDVDRPKVSPLGHH